MVIRSPEISRTGEGIYPFQMGYLPDQFQRKAETELKDSLENRERGLRLMREMATKDKHFDGLAFDDDFLLQYLRCRKFNVKRAFSQLKALVNLRRKQPNAFSNFKFENLAITTRNKIVTFLPWRCPDGCVILLIQLDNWEPEEFPTEEIKRMVVIFLLQALRDPMTQVNGFKVIFDVKSNPIKHIRYCTPSNIHLLYYGPMECSPGRFKSIHILNESLTFKAAYLIVRPFLSTKIKQRIHFHSKPEELLDFFPRSIMPVQYGGDLVDYDMTDWLKEVLQPEKLATLAGGNIQVQK